MALLLLCLWRPAAAARPPVRAVSLAPNLTELVFALGFGDQLVGRSSACDYPAEVRNIPVAGDFGRPNWEVVQGLKPNLVVATDLEKREMARHLERTGIRVLLLPCESWEQLMDAARKLGEAFGEPEAGGKWVADMTARRTTLERRVAEAWRGRRRPRVYTEVWGDPPTTVGRNTFLSDIVSLAGGENIGADLRGTYIHVSSEWVIAEDPDAVLLAYMTSKSPPAASLAKRPGWDSIRAVKSGTICTGIPPDWLLRSGPRLIDGAEALADWLMSVRPEL